MVPTGIAVLREFFDGVAIPFGLSGPDPEYALAVYHNPFAKHPLDPGRLVGSRVSHYRMKEDQSSWEPYPSACKDLPASVRAAVDAF